MTTTMPASTTAKMATNLVTTKKLLSRVLALVLMELAALMMTRTRMERSLCLMLPA